MTSIEDKIRRIVEQMADEAQHNQEQELPGTTEQEAAPETNTQTPPDEIQDIYVLILRERAEEGEPTRVAESTLVLSQKPSVLPAYAFCCLYLLLVVCTLAFQLSCIFNPPIATVTIIPKSQTVTLTGTLQLGRLLNPITISQSQTTATTGKGHQEARSATGYLTFYNGQFQRVTIAAGTILTGADDVQVALDQEADVPPESQTIPPTLGQATVSAHAVVPGTQGNIPTGDINQRCCASSLLVQNNAPFHGGQDEREFQTVAQRDISSAATPLEPAVARSANDTFQGQRKAGERVFILPCRPSVTSDHQVGAEATTVTVTVSATCSAVAYRSQEVATQVTALLSTQARQQTGAGYSLLGTVHISVQHATVSRSAAVLLSFSASGTWVYGLSGQAQAQIIHLLAGKTTQEAVQDLSTLPGVERAAIRFTGFGDETRLPKRNSLIRLVFVVM